MGTIQKLDAPDYLCGEAQWESPSNVQLYQAARKGDLGELRSALDQGANPNYFNTHDDGAPGVLHAAARKSTGTDFDAALCAKELIGKGAQISAALISNRNTPIHEAATVGSKEVCEVIIEASPLDHNIPEVLETENSFGNTALHAAARSGHVDIVKLLLQKGSDPNKVNHRGSTALHIAAVLASNNGKEAGTKPSSKQSKDGEISSTGPALFDPYLTIAAILLCHDDVDVNIRDVNGYTPLHIAAQQGCDAMVKLLVDSGASVTAKTNIDSKKRGGRTPAGMAAFSGHESTRVLLESFAVALDHGKKIATKKMAKEISN